MPLDTLQCLSFRVRGLQLYNIIFLRGTFFLKAATGGGGKGEKQKLASPTGMQHAMYCNTVEI